MPPTAPHKIASGAPILDSMGNPIIDGKYYKIRVADGSEITLGRYIDNSMVGLAPTNSGDFWRVQVDTGKGTPWKNGTGQIKLWSHNKTCWTVATHELDSTSRIRPRFSLLQPQLDDTKNRVQQWMQGVQDQKGGIWIAMGQFALKAGQPCKGESYEETDYVRVIRCEDRGPKGGDFSFECTFVPDPVVPLA
ncbi:hypothetical protein ACHAQJ_008382 [Trichoderma viride]